MSEKQRRIKIITNDGFGAQVIDTETGANLSNVVTNIVIRIDESTDMRAVAEITIVDVDVEVKANVEVETTKQYRRLE